MRVLGVGGLIALIVLFTVGFLWLRRSDPGPVLPAVEAGSQEVGPFEGRAPLEVGNSSFAAEPAGTARTSRTVIPTEPAAEDGFMLRGVVRDDLGAPLSEFEVATELSGPGATPRREFRGLEDGVFELPGFGPGRSVVSVSARGHVALGTLVEFPFEGRLEVSLPRRARVSGLVVDGAGVPVPRAEVRVSPLVAMRSYELVATTARDGVFAFEVDPLELDVRVSAPGYLPMESRELRLDRGQEFSDLVLRLEGGGGVEGKVLPLTGQPRVRSVQLRDGRSFAQTYKVESDGGFRATGIPGGAYVLSVPPTPAEVRSILGRRNENGTNLLTRHLRVDVVEGESTQVLVDAGELQLTRVEVSVTLNGALPGAGGLSARSRELASIDALLLHEELDGEGRFEMTVVPGTWWFEAVVDDGCEDVHVAFVEEVLPGTEHRVSLQLRTGAISGRVRTLAGEPLADLWVLAEGRDGERRFEASASTDESGEYRLGALPAGEYVVRTADGDLEDPFAVPRVVDAQRDGLLVRAGVDTAHVDFTLGPGGGVQIFTSAREQARAATVLRLSAASESVDVPYVDSLRCFAATGLEPGSYEVTVARGPLRLLEPLAVEVSAAGFTKVGAQLE